MDRNHPIMKYKHHEMAWNEPGNKDDKSPGGDKESSINFENWLKKLNNKIPSGGNGDGSDRTLFFWLGIIIVFIAVIYVASGFFIVEPQEEAVILQFGKYKETIGAGPHWIPRLIDSAIVVDVQGIQNYSYSANMLTRDENIVDVSVAVQYRIDDPDNYLFNVKNPVTSLQQATASSLRQVIGNTDLDSVLTSGREEVSKKVKKQLVSLLNRYQPGIEITQIALQPAKAPEAVKDAFDDAIKAREDEQRYINQGQAYRMQIIPRAKGQKERILADARAYKEQVVLNSQGEIARYLALLPEYQTHPVVTRERLYLDAIQNILSKTTKIFVDQQQGNNTLMYLPLDKLMSMTASQQQVRQVPLKSANSVEAGTANTRSQKTAYNTQSNSLPGYGSNDATNGYSGVLNEGNR